MFLVLVEKFGNLLSFLQFFWPSNWENSEFSTVLNMRLWQFNLNSCILYEQCVSQANMCFFSIGQKFLSWTKNVRLFSWPLDHNLSFLKVQNAFLNKAKIFYRRISKPPFQLSSEWCKNFSTKRGFDPETFRSPQYHHITQYGHLIKSCQ